MPYGIGIGQVLGLVRETRGLEQSAGAVAISGPGAQELAIALGAGGDPTAIRVDGDPLESLAAVRLVNGDPSPGEVAALRRIARAGTPLVVVRQGEGGRIPNVLPLDVVEAGLEDLVEVVAEALARAAPDVAPSLGARLPALRPAVARRLIGSTAATNAVLAASIRKKQAQMPVLTLAQVRMLLQLGVSRGDVLPRDPQQLAVAAGPALAGSLGIGLLARALVRRSPLSGPVVQAAVAYAGTRALGAAWARR